MEMNYIPYTYLIGWTNINKWYYGVEYGVKKEPRANPNNLWKTYFTSSSVVKYFVEKYGDPDIIEVRKTFTSGSIEERMEKSITWEKKVLSKINISEEKWLNGRIGGDVTPVANKKIARIRYNVDNVFQSDEIKQKIKETNLRKYGVEHPSYSKELLKKKSRNNLIKYGVECTLNLPDIKEKSQRALNTEFVKNQRKETIIRKYGVEFISQHDGIKEKITEKKKIQSNRPIVFLLREYQRVFNITLSSGWYQKSDELLSAILCNMQTIHGIHTYDELSNVEIPKKYSSSIKKLQERTIVQKIKKYKQKYGRNLKLGRCWDRKDDSHLEHLLIELQSQYDTL